MTELSSNQIVLTPNLALILFFPLKIILFIFIQSNVTSGIRGPVFIYFLAFIFIYLAVSGLIADHRIVDLHCGMEDL